MTEVGTSLSGESHGPDAARSGSENPGVGVPVVVTVVEAPACHLCADAKSALVVIAQSYPITVSVLSVLEEPGRTLMQEHRAPMSPLVLLDGEYFSSGRLPRRKLEKRLKKAQQGETQ